MGIWVHEVTRPFAPDTSLPFEAIAGRRQEAAWAQAAAVRGQEIEFLEGGNQEVQLIEAFADIERKLEAAIGAAPPASPTLVRHMSVLAARDWVKPVIEQWLTAHEILSTPTKAALKSWEL